MPGFLARIFLPNNLWESDILVTSSRGQPRRVWESVYA